MKKCQYCKEEYQPLSFRDRICSNCRTHLKSIESQVRLSYHKSYYNLNKSKWPTYAEVKAKATSSHYSRMAQIKYKFNIIEQELRDMMDKQKGLCLICNDSLTDPKRHRLNQFNIDHNHKTGEVRGLLCSKCNTGLGYLKDNPKILREAADYLEQRGYYG